MSGCYPLGVVVVAVAAAVVVVEAAVATETGVIVVAATVAKRSSVVYRHRLPLPIVLPVSACSTRILLAVPNFHPWEMHTPPSGRSLLIQALGSR